MAEGTRTPNAPTLEWSLEHLESYLDGRIDIFEFWQPFPRVLEAYKDHPAGAFDRLPYYWRRVSRAVGDIIRLGYSEDDDFRRYMRRWHDALSMDEERWRSIVARKGEPLMENIEDWDR